MGNRLSAALRKQLSGHPCVGDIRGRGLFWAIEFVADKNKATPFAAQLGVAGGLAQLGRSQGHEIFVYPGSGTADGVNGDHIILAPPYNVTEEEIDLIVLRVSRLVNAFFQSKAIMGS